MGIEARVKKEKKKKKGYKNKSCLRPLRLMDGEHMQGGKSGATFTLVSAPKQ